MRYFIDTEFAESGSNNPVELLSLAIVADDGRWFYGANAEANLARCNDWVTANVLPHIDFAQDGYHYHDLRANLIDLVGDDASPEFWGWCCDYDYVLISQLVGFDRWPAGWPYYFRDLQQLADEYGVSLDSAASLYVSDHNALSDARQIDLLHSWVMKTIGKDQP